MRHSAADGIARIVGNYEIHIRSLLRERIVAGNPELLTILPPAVLGSDDLGMKGLIQFGLEANSARGRFDSNPFVVSNVQ